MLYLPTYLYKSLPRPSLFFHYLEVILKLPTCIGRKKNFQGKLFLFFPLLSSIQTNKVCSSLLFFRIEIQRNFPDKKEIWILIAGISKKKKLRQVFAACSRALSEGETIFYWQGSLERQ